MMAALGVYYSNCVTLILQGDLRANSSQMTGIADTDSL